MSVYFAGFVPCEQGYAVFFPDLTGCHSQGATLQEAFFHVHGSPCRPSGGHGG